MAEQIMRLWAVAINAEDWFTSAGWRRVDRSEATIVIGTTQQLGRVCTASAALLARDLT